MANSSPERAEDRHRLDSECFDIPITCSSTLEKAELQTLQQMWIRAEYMPGRRITAAATSNLVYRAWRKSLEDKGRLMRQYELTPFLIPSNPPGVSGEVQDSQPLSDSASTITNPYEDVNH